MGLQPGSTMRSRWTVDRERNAPGSDRCRSGPERRRLFDGFRSSLGHENRPDYGPARQLTIVEPDHELEEEFDSKLRIRKAQRVARTLAFLI